MYIGCIVFITLNSGGGSVSSLYNNGLSDHLSAPMTAVMMSYSIRSAVGILCGTAVAALVTRIPIKRLLLIGSVLLILSYALVSMTHSLYLFYFSSILQGVGTMLTGQGLLQSALANWYAKGLGKKMGGISVASALGASAFSVLIAGLIESVGFQRTYFMHGIVLGTLFVLSTVCLISESPQKYGLLPYGFSEEAEVIPQKAPCIEDVDDGPSMTECLRFPLFWVTIIGLFCSGGICSSFVSNAANIYGSLGLTSMQTASIVSVQNVFAAIWMFVYGGISDRVGGLKSTMYMCLISTAALLACSVVCLGAPGIFGAAIIAVMIGATYYVGMEGALTFAGLFGKKAFAPMVQLNVVAINLGSMLGTPLASMIYERTCSYLGFMVLGLVLMVAVTMSKIVIQRKKLSLLSK